MKKNNIYISFGLIVLFFCMVFTSCSKNKESEFTKLETQMQNTQKAFAEMVNYIKEEPTDKNLKKIKKNKKIDTNELEDLIKNTCTYMSTYSSTVGIWKNQLPQEVLEMQLMPLANSKIADKCKIDFLNNTLNYRNDGCYSFNKIEDGYVFEITDDADAPFETYSYTKNVIQGNTKEDVCFSKLSFYLSENKLPSSFNYEYLENGKYVVFRFDCDWTKDNLSAKADELNFSAYLQYSSLEEMKTYESDISYPERDKYIKPDSPEKIDEEKYQKALVRYNSLTDTCYNLFFTILRNYDLQIEGIYTRANNMRNDYIAMDDYLEKNKVDVYSFVEEYTNTFYKNFTFSPVIEKFYIENGVLKEYLGWEDIVEIPEGVTKISSSCSLFGKTLILPESLKEIEVRTNRYKLADILGFSEIQIKGDDPSFYIDGAYLKDKDGNPICLINNDKLDIIDFSEVTYNDILDYAHACEKYMDPDDRSDPDFIYGRINSVKEIIIDVKEFENCENLFPNLEKITFLENSNVTQLELNFDNTYKNLKEVVIPNNIKNLEIEIFNPLDLSLIIDSNYSLNSFRLNSGSITSFDIPEAQDIYIDCANLVSIKIPTSAKSVNINSNQLLELDIPEGVTNAIVSCNNLITLSVPSSLNTSYFYIPNVEKITYLEGCTTIKNINNTNCFSNLKEVVLPSGVETIEDYSFASSNLEKIVIPNSVTSIGEFAFENCKNLKEVVLSENLSFLGKGAFEGCTSLESIQLPSSLTTIEPFTFYECTSLVNINLEEGLTAIKECALYNTGIKSLIIPSTVEVIESFITSSEMELLEIKASDNIYDYISISDPYHNVIHINKVIIPENVLSFDVNVNVSSLEVYGKPTIKINQNVNSVFLNNVFENEYQDYISSTNSDIPFSCNISFASSTTYFKITYLNNDGSVFFEEEILEGSFYNVTKECESKLPGTNEKMYFFKGWNYNSNDVYNQRILIKDNIILEAIFDLEDIFSYEEVDGGIKVLGFQRSDYNPESIYIPTTLYGKEVVSYAFGAFSNCTRVKELTLPFIYNENGLYSLLQLFISNTYPYEVPKTLEKVIVTSENVIGGFFNCSNIKYIEYKSSVTSVLDHAFENCSSLEELVLLDNQISSIGFSSFYNCSLTSLDLPSTLKKIDRDAFIDFYGDISFKGSLSEYLQIELGNEYSSPFVNSKKLVLNQEEIKEVIIPDTIKKINSYSFYNCENLEKVTIPNSVTYIGESVFFNCINIKEISIPFIGESITSVNSNLAYLFGLHTNSYYTSPNSLLPSSLKVVRVTGSSIIYSTAFRFSQYLTHIYISKDIQEIYNGAFEGCSSLEFLSLPYFCGTKSNQNGIWSAFKDYTNIPSSLREVEFVDSATISRGTFTNCPETLEIIRFKVAPSKFEENAFYKYVDIENVENQEGYLPKKVYFESIEDFLNIQVDYNGGLFCYAEYAENQPKLFIDNEELVDLVIPSSITSISMFTLCNYKKLNSLVIHESVTSIGSYAFYNCTNLIKITYNAKNCYLDYFCFAEIGGDLFIGDKVETLTEFGFNRSGVSSITFDDNCKIETIPSSVFNGTKITELVIPESVKTIGSSAFANNDIYELIIPDNVTSIASGAFSGSYNLISVELPDHLSDVADNAFSDSYNLEVAKIPVNVLNNISLSKLKELYITCGVINSYYSLTNLQSLKIGEDANVNDLSISVGDSFKDIYYNSNVISSSNRVNVYNPNITFDVTIGNKVKELPSRLFYQQAIKNVYFEEGSVCESLNYATFESEVLESIEIPTSLKYFNEGIIRLNKIKVYYQGSLIEWINNIVDHQNLLSYGSFIDPTIEYDLYINNELLTELCLPSDITSIPSYSFAYCTSISSIELTNPLDSIGKHAFGFCSSLVKANLDGVKNIDEQAFEYCTNLEEVITLNLQTIGGAAFGSCSSLYSINLLEGLTTLDEYSFSNCSSLKEITIPESVTSIGLYCFSGCTGLEKINYNAINCQDLSDSNFVFKDVGNDASKTIVNIGNKVEHLPSHLFAPYYREDLTNISEINFMEGSILSSIGSYAFGGLAKLTKLSIPSSVTSVGNQILYGCLGLEELELPSLYEKALEKHFNWYSIPTSLIKITINSGEIIDEALKETNSIQTIILGEEVTIINSYAFYGCSELTNLTINGTITYIGDYAFANTNISSIDLTDDLTYLGSYAFSNSSLETITIPSSITTINEYTFSGCVKLTTINLHDDIDTIFNYAFNRCTSLESISLPSGLTTIGSNVFDYCSSLVDLVIPDNIEKFCSMNYCASLTNIYYGNGLTSKVGIFGENNVKNLYVKNFENWCSYQLNPYLKGVNLYINDEKVDDLVIPETITSISKECFYGTTITSVLIRETMVSIGANAFGCCSELISATIKNAETIGSEIFAGCSSLVFVTVPFIGEKKTNPTKTSFAYFFNSYSDCTLIPESVKDITVLSGRIEEYAFKNCYHFTGIKLGEEVTTVYTNSFEGCAALAYANVYNYRYAPTYIQTLVLNGSQTSIDLSSYTSLSSLSLHVNQITSYILPSSLKTLTIGSEVTYFTNGLLENVTDVIFEDTSSWQVSSDNVTWTNIYFDSSTVSNVVETYKSYYFKKIA